MRTTRQGSKTADLTGHLLACSPPVVEPRIHTMNGTPAPAEQACEQPDRT